MKRILVNIKCDLNNVPDLDVLLPKEYETAGRLREMGILEHVFSKDNANGAVLIFKNTDEEQVKQYVETFPLSPYFDTVEYISAEMNF